MARPSNPVSWLESANTPDCPFSLANLPLAVMRKVDAEGEFGVLATVLGDKAVDLLPLIEAGLFDDCPHADELEPIFEEMNWTVAPVTRAALTDVRTVLQRFFAAGDAGTALGACYYIYHQVLGQPRQPVANGTTPAQGFVLQNAYTGPCYSDSEIEKALDRYSLAYEKLTQDALVTRVAKLVAAGNVVGWFQGRMEWGPRALGNRTILADPRRADMKDILNARIKHRETFRPFAPSILAEDVGAYFDQTYPDPFMIKVYNVLPEKRAVIPAVTHVDGTGRLQTVDQVAAPLYWKLINAFKIETGVPVVLNTSFNENELIVCTPDQAIGVLERTKMDALAIGNYLVVKD